MKSSKFEIQNSKRKQNTSWQKSAKWYSKIVSKKGHYFHQHTVIPNVLDLNQVANGQSVLDLACGQGVLARNLPDGVEYVGIDSAPDLIAEAKQLDKTPLHKFYIGDVTKRLPVEKYDFDFATIILALQNIRQPNLALLQTANHLKDGGVLTVVLNHPCFRIPRQSSWGIDKDKKIEFRRVDRYMSEMEIPITTHPGKHVSPVTWSFHHPLSSYFAWLRDAGFLVRSVEEWTSDKVSKGKAAKMENRSRDEFPMFMAIVAIKS